MAYKINNKIKTRMDRMVSLFIKEKRVEMPIGLKYGSKLGRSFSPLTIQILDTLEQPTQPRDLYFGKNTVERKKITQILWNLHKQKYIMQLPDGRIVKRGD